MDKLTAEQGTVLVVVVVDQSASIGALILAVARDADCRVAYLPGMTMCRIADLFPSETRATPPTPSSSPTPTLPAPFS